MEAFLFLMIGGRDLLVCQDRYIREFTFYLTDNDA